MRRHNRQGDLGGKVTTKRSRDAAAAAPPQPTECRRRAGAVFVTCSRHVVHQQYVARFL